MVPFATHAYNTSVQASTKVSPFRTLYGRDPRFPPEIHTIDTSNPKYSDAADWWLYLHQTQPLLRRAIQHNLHIAQQRQKKNYDQRRKEVTYQPDDLVLLYFHVRRRGLRESLIHRWIGPYRVIEPLRANSYRLQRLSNHTTTTAHVTRMKTYVEKVPPPSMQLRERGGVVGPSTM